MSRVTILGVVFHRSPVLTRFIHPMRWAVRHLCQPIALALLRRYRADGGGKRGMGCRIHWPVLDLGARRIFPKVVVAFPVGRRSDGSGHKPPTAIGTDVGQDALDTGSAERAFVGADACFECVWRQRLVAVLTRWSEFKHGVPFL